MSDDDLLVAAAGGDERAFAEIYDRFAGRVHGVVRKVLRDHAQSEEVTQEVFVEAWRKAGRFDPELGTATTWLLVMARRRAIDRVRQEQASRDRRHFYSERDGRRSVDSVAEEVERSWEHVRIRDGLEQLTELQRDAIRIAYYGGKTYRETAELLGVPLGTAKSRIRDGLIKLRDILDDPATVHAPDPDPDRAGAQRWHRSQHRVGVSAA